MLTDPAKATLLSSNGQENQLKIDVGEAASSEARAGLFGAFTVEKKVSKGVSHLELSNSTEYHAIPIKIEKPPLLSTSGGRKNAGEIDLECGTELQPARTASGLEAAVISGEEKKLEATDAAKGDATCTRKRDAESKAALEAAVDALENTVSVQVDFDTTGLTSTRVDELREQYGWNEVEPHLEPEWVKIARRYLSLVPMLLITAALFAVCVVEDGVRDWFSFALLVFLDNLMVWADYLGERSAHNAIAAVRKLGAPQCTVKRDGTWSQREVRELVPGDIVSLKAGVIIPADGIFVTRDANVTVDEAALTGESLPIRKRPGASLLSGSVIQKGEGEMRVEKIGKDSFYGKTISLLAHAERPGHLRTVLHRTEIFITSVAICCAIFLFFWQSFHHDWILIIPRDRYLIAAKRAFILIASVIPAAMPVVTTTVLSVGALILTRQNAAVSRLSAIEEAAGVVILFSDKTGTLTKNHLSLFTQELVVEPGFDAKTVLLYASLCSDVREPEPIDRTINDNTDMTERSKYKISEYVPFNPVDKRTQACIVAPDGRCFLVTKGAPHIIRDMVCVNHSKEDEDLRARLNEMILEKAKRGFRTLGVAMKPVRSGVKTITTDASDPVEASAVPVNTAAPGTPCGAAGPFEEIENREQHDEVEHQNQEEQPQQQTVAALRESEAQQPQKLGGDKDEKPFAVCDRWVLVGYISLFDPPREDTAQTIKRARELGIRVIMITGDQQAIAIETARQLELGTNIAGADIWAEEERSGTVHGKPFADYIESVDGFAGVFPEHKFAIVDSMMDAHKLVAMTGDGVNDAPALKRATVGIAVSGATDAARAAADIILFAPGLDTIISVIELSRQIFKRVESYIIFRIFTSLIILGMWWGSIVILRYQFPAWVLVLMSMINDFVLMSCSHDNVSTSKAPMIWSMMRVILLSTWLGFCATCCILMYVVFSDPSYHVNWWHRWNLSDFVPNWPVPASKVNMSYQTNAGVWLLMSVLIQLCFQSVRTRGFFFIYNDRNRVPALIIIVPQCCALIVTVFLVVYWKQYWRVASGPLVHCLNWGQAWVTMFFGFLCFLFMDVTKVVFYRWMWGFIEKSSIYKTLASMGTVEPTQQELQNKSAAMKAFQYMIRFFVDRQEQFSKFEDRIEDRLFNFANAVTSMVEKKHRHLHLNEKYFGKQKHETDAPHAGSSKHTSSTTHNHKSNASA